jgi:hypothetical protein
MSGVSSIQYFSPQIFAQIGITTSRSLLFQAVNAIIAFVGTSICIMTIDSLGRRPLQIFGYLFLCVTFVINAAIIKIYPTDSNNTSAHWAFVAFTWLFNLGKLDQKLMTCALTDNLNSLLHHQRSPKLGHPRRTLRHRHASQRRLLRRNDILRLQHYDRPSYADRHHRDRLGKQSTPTSKKPGTYTNTLRRNSTSSS